MEFHFCKPFRSRFPAAGVTIPEGMIFGFWEMSGTTFVEFP